MCRGGDAEYMTGVIKKFSWPMSKELGTQTNLRKPPCLRPKPTPQNWVHRFWGCLTVPVSADMRLEEARPSTSPLQRGRGPRFLVRLAPRAPALTAGSGDLPRARRGSELPAL